jgi:uncharacterized UPF0160 family protein
MNNEAIIAVCHSGQFHADEVMACALLRLAAGQSHVAFIRSRDPKDWARADYVLDVGEKYDGIKWFDHHQFGFNEQRLDGSKYSCFGLLWRVLGITMLREVLAPFKLEDAAFGQIADSMEAFVEAIDLNDQAQLEVYVRCKNNKAVKLEMPTLATCISDMNSVPLIELQDEMTQNHQFYEALDYATKFLERAVYRRASEEILAVKYVNSRITADPILYLPEYCSWYRVVESHPHIQYVISPSNNKKAFQVQAVKSGKLNTAENLRTPFPENWAGRSVSRLAQISGVPDALFCHSARFQAAAKSLEGARELARKSIVINNQIKT